MWCAAPLGVTKVISGSVDATVRVWDAKTGRCERLLQGHESTVSAVLATPDGRIISGSWDCRVKVWADGRDDRPVCEFAHDGKVTAVIALGERLVTGSADRTVRVWSLRTGACEHVLEGHALPVEHLCATDDAHFTSAGPDNTLRKWNVETGCLVRYQMARELDFLCFSTARLDCPASAQSGRVSFTLPKGKDFRSVKLASGAHDGTLRMFFWTVRVRGLPSGIGMNRVSHALSVGVLQQQHSAAVQTGRGMGGAGVPKQKAETVLTLSL